MKNKEEQNLKSFMKSISSKKEKGITLVALVVTIIVLLILAGVAINMVLGDNGLFKKAKEAVNAWKEAEENETGVLDYLYTEWDNIINGGAGTKPTTPPEEPPKPQEPVLMGETVDNIRLPENAEAPITVTIGEEKVTIPPKFTIAEDSGKTVSEGIAVIDSQGNEWVWIPCYVSGGENVKKENLSEEEQASYTTEDNYATQKGIIKYDRYAFTRTSPTWESRQTKSSQKDPDGSYKIISNSDSEKDQGAYWHEGLSTTSDVYLSISKYGGYYIGRYEAGDKESTELKEMRTEEKYYNDRQGDATHTVTVKKNQVPYTYVTDSQCAQLSREMTSENGTDTDKLDGTKVFTRLCSSYSFDTAIKFIEKTHPNYGTMAQTKDGEIVDNYKESSFSYKNIEGINETKNENSSVLIPTGQTKGVCSIYDMGGNADELTSEYRKGPFNDHKLWARGGYYGSTYLNAPPAHRSSFTYSAYRNRFPSYFVREVNIKRM